MEKMILSLVLCCLCLWRLDGVFSDADAVESVSVSEGDPVTLNSGLTQIMDDDVILWMFGYKSISKICVKDGRIIANDVPDGRFRDRLKLDKHTGSLTITNTRPEHSGVYELLTNSVRKSFILNVQYCSSCTLSAVNEMTGMEGYTFTITTGVTELKADDVIQWRFVTENTLIAEINKRANRSTVFYDVLNGIFRDKLNLNSETGTLKFTNFRTEHNGIYEALHNSVRKKSHILTVFARLPASATNTDCLLSSTSGSDLNPIRNQTTHLDIDTLGQPGSESVSGCGSAEAVIRLVVTALMGVADVAAIVVLVYDIRSRRAEGDQIHTSET